MHVRVQPHAVLLALLLTGAAAHAAGRADQSWRDASLSSFDEAWQAIHETYYDPTFGGLDWAAVRDELRPRVEAARSPDHVREIIREMLARLGQSHFALIASVPASRAPGDARVPVEIRLSGSRFVITGLDPDSSAAAVGLSAGDIIRAVDGESTAGWLPDDGHRDERRRALEAVEHALAALAGPDGSRVNLTVEGRDGERTVTVTRARERGRVVKFGNLPPLSVRADAREQATPAGRRAGVIAFNVWMPAATATIDAAVDRFRDAAGLVIDLRGNPGGLVEMIRGVAGHLIDEPVSLGRMQTRQAELEFRVNPRRSTSDGRRVDPFAGPVALLVDELTASASECFAGSLQSLGRARIFGRQTMGQALPAATRRLSNGDVLLHVLGDFVTPTGVRLEQRGVVPDEPVPLSIDALRAGRDLALEAALAWIDREASAHARLP